METFTRLYDPKEKIERNKKIFALRKQGMSHNQIAKELGTTGENVRRILKQHAGKYANDNNL